MKITFGESIILVTVIVLFGTLLGFIPALLGVLLVHELLPNAFGVSNHNPPPTK